MKALENYVYKTYPASQEAFVHEKEPTHILTQLRINQNMNLAIEDEIDKNSDSQEFESTNQELWIIRDDPEHNRWEFICMTLYKLQITSKKLKEVERNHYFPYENLWKIFGVDRQQCSDNDIKMFLTMLLDTMVLEMPTMNTKHNKNEDSETEEEVHIMLRNIGIICHERHIVDVDGSKVPLTISLIGNQERYFGIKAVVYNRLKKKEDGIFLRVDTEEWKYAQEIIDTFPPVRKKDPMKYFYELPKLLDTKGFEFIYNNLKFSEDKIPFITNELGAITNIDSYSKRYLKSVLEQAE